VTGAAARALGARAGQSAAASTAPARLAARRAATWPHTTWLLPWMLATFLAMIWLTPFDNVDLPISLPLDASLDRPLLGAMAVLWILALSGSVGFGRLRSSGVHRALAIFALIATLSILLNHETLARLGELDTAIKKLVLLFSYGAFFVIAVSVIRPAEVPRLVKFMLGLASITAIGVLVEYRLGYNAFYNWTGLVFPGTDPPPDIGTYDSIGRKTIVGPGGHPLAAAMMMSIALPFALVGALDAKERRTKVWHALAAALMLAAAMATQRKTSFVVPVVSIAVLCAYRPRAMLRMLPWGLVLLIAIHGVAPGALGGVTDQLKPGAFSGVLTTQDRVDDYGAIKPEIAAHLMLGRGYESYDQIKYRILDNQYLTLIVNVGLLGILAYLGVIAAALWYAHRCTRSRDPARARVGIAAMATITGMLVGSALLDTLALPQLPYLFCFVAALVVVMAQTEEAHGFAGR
jgi:polysaccharide biosynthesis protein PslJ